MIARLVCLTLLTATATALAAPVHVDVERCPALDADAVDVAVARELAMDPKLVERARQVAISLECPDGLKVNAKIVPDPTAGRLARELDLAEEPAGLRVKLVALAVAELVDELDATPARRAPGHIIDDEDDAPPRVVVKTPTLHAPNITLRAGLRLFADDQYPMASVSPILHYST